MKEVSPRVCESRNIEITILFVNNKLKNTVIFSVKWVKNCLMEHLTNGFDKRFY